VGILAIPKIPWPFEIRFALNWWKLFSLNEFKGLEKKACLTGMVTYSNVFYAYVLSPLVVGGVLLGVTCIHTVCNTLIHRTRSQPENISKRKARNQNTKRRFMIIERLCVSLLSVVQAGAVRFCLRTFNCVALNGTEESILVLEAAPHMDCGSTEHSSMAVVSAVGLVVYLIGWIFYLGYKINFTVSKPPTVYVLAGKHAGQIGNLIEDKEAPGKIHLEKGGAPDIVRLSLSPGTFATSGASRSLFQCQSARNRLKVHGPLFTKFRAPDFSFQTSDKAVKEGACIYSEFGNFLSHNFFLLDVAQRMVLLVSAIFIDKTTYSLLTLFSSLAVLLTGMIARPLVKTHESLAADGTIVRTRIGVVESGIASALALSNTCFISVGCFGFNYSEQSVAKWGAFAALVIKIPIYASAIASASRRVRAATRARLQQKPRTCSLLGAFGYCLVTFTLGFTFCRTHLSDATDVFRFRTAIGFRWVKQNYSNVLAHRPWLVLLAIAAMSLAILVSAIAGCNFFTPWPKLVLLRAGPAPFDET
jgi:hypothetical protein